MERFNLEYCKKCCNLSCSCQVGKTEDFEMNLVENKRTSLTDSDEVLSKMPKNLQVINSDKSLFTLYHMLIFLNALRNKSVSVIQLPDILKNSVIDFSISGIRNSLDFDDSYVAFHGLKMFYENQIYFLTETLCTIFEAFQRSTILLKDNEIIKYEINKNTSHCNSFNSITTNFENSIYQQDVESNKVQHLYQCFLLLLTDYNYVENINAELLKKIKELEMKFSTVTTENNSSTSCKSCIKFNEDLQKTKGEYNIILKNYSLSQTEKERMVMKYATSEKHLIEAQRSVKLLEKKYQEILKENGLFQKKIKKAHDDAIKLTSEINNKCVETTQLRNQIEHQKDKDNAKEMKLKYTQNRLRLVTDDLKETQLKLDESLIQISKLSNECELLRSQRKNTNQNVQNSEENNIINIDQKFKEQQPFSQLDCHTSKDSETLEVKNQPNFDSLIDKKSLADKENQVLIAQIQTLRKECIDYESQLNVLNVALEKEKKGVDNLKDTLTNIEITNKQQLQSTEHRISKMEMELNKLYSEKAEFQSDIEAYKQREIQILDFTQKLTDKNVQLQCEFSNMQANLRLLESNQDPLRTSINKFIRDINTLENNLSYEKEKSEEECEILTKYIAEQVFYINQLSHQLEDLEGENAVLRKKYELAIREINRELHLHYTKCPLKNFQTPSFIEIRNNDNTASVNKDCHDVLKEMDTIEEKHKTSEVLEKEKLFNQIIKLQKINAKRAERLDFLEEHSHALLEELQRKKNNLKF